VNPNLKKIVDLVKIAGIIEGRTKFQKIVYILKTRNISFSEKFRYHYYGPYSSDLQLEIDELVDMDILHETPQSPYKYSLNLDNQKEPIDSELQSNAKLINYLAEKDSQELELVSTIFFLKNNGYKNNELISEKLQILKPHLMNLEIKAFQVADKIEKEF
jgi:uncharacterized protein